MVVGVENSKRNWRVRLVRYAPFLIWTAMIFIASSSTGSAENTSRFIRPLLEFIFYSAEPAFIDSIHFLMRKTAHFVFYGILALFALHAFTGSSKSILGSRPAVSAFFAVFMIASLDEFNQSFNPARTGNPMDVLLDLAGASFFLILTSLIKRTRPD